MKLTPVCEVDLKETQVGYFTNKYAEPLEIFVLSRALENLTESDGFSRIQGQCIIKIFPNTFKKTPILHPLNTLCSTPTVYFHLDLFQRVK